MRLSLPAALLFLPLLPLAATPAGVPASDGAAPAARYYGDAERGWFWYESLPPEPEPAPAPPRIPPTPGAGGDGPPAPLTARWFRERLDDYRDEAMDRPTEENVATYLYLQRLAVEKADAFRLAGERVLRSYPGLDEDARTPQSAPAKAAAREAATPARKAAMARVASQAGLWYFLRSDCPYCARQGPILRMLEGSTGIPILPITLDGRPTPDGLYPQARPDSGQGARLGVRVTPTLFLVTADGRVAPLAEGLHTLPELEDRVLAAAAEAGLISDAEADAARSRVSSSMLALLPESLPPEIAADPVRLAAVLRAAAAEAGGATPVPAAASPLPGGTPQ